MLPAQDALLPLPAFVFLLRKEREERGTLVLLMPARSRACATRRASPTQYVPLWKR
jgi:hypothetical protein